MGFAEREGFGYTGFHPIEAVEQQYENNIFVHANYIDQVDTNGSAQTFTPQANHRLTLVKVKVARRGTPGIITLTIHATDGDGHPTGAALATETFDGDALTSDLSNPEIKEITISLPPTLSASTKYAIKMTVTSFLVRYIYLAWYCDEPGSYINGKALQWNTIVSDWRNIYSDNTDFYFDEWGTPT